MKLEIIETGYFKLDGGAMFGVVPKRIWNKLNPADNQNMCTWSMRCLLLDDGESVILFDTGLGDKQDQKFQSHFEPHGTDSLLQSLLDKGYQPEDITDVFLTHFHFDHVGGACQHDDGGGIVPTFPNATYWTNKSHLATAMEPNPREKASFLKENFVPILEAGRMAYIEETNGVSWKKHITVDYYHGHTKAMMAPTINLPNGNKITYAADLLPSSFHVKMPYIMAYDMDPLLSMEEKTSFYKTAIAENHYIFFEHDPVTICGKLELNERGRYSITPVDFQNIIQ